MFSRWRRWRIRRKLGKIGLVLSAGGLTGAMHVGYLKALFEWLKELYPDDEFPVEYFGGTSAGALTIFAIVSSLARADTWQSAGFGLRYARDTYGWIEGQGPEAVFDTSLWHILFSRNIWKGKCISPTGNDILFRILGNLFDAEEIVRWDKKFEVGVWNHNKGRYEVLSNHDDRFNPDKGGNPEEFVQAIIASASLFPYFPMVQIGMHCYSDGDYPRIVPALADGCDTVLVFHSYKREVEVGEHEAHDEQTAGITDTKEMHHLERLMSKFGIKWLQEWLEKYDKLRHRGRQELTKTREWIMLNRSFWERMKSLVRELFGLEAKLPKSPRVVQVFADPDALPPTFSSRGFALGDFERVQEAAYIKAKKVLDKTF